MLVFNECTLSCDIRVERCLQEVPNYTHVYSCPRATHTHTYVHTQAQGRTSFERQKGRALPFAGQSVCVRCECVSTCMIVVRNTQEKTSRRAPVCVRVRSVCSLSVHGRQAGGQAGRQAGRQAGTHVSPLPGSAHPRMRRIVCMCMCVCVYCASAIACMRRKTETYLAYGQT